MDADLPALPSRSRAAVNRLLFGVLSVTATTLIGSAGVVAAYYPLRHAGAPLQWLLVLGLMTLESMAIHLPSEVILPAGGWLVVKDHGLGSFGVVGLSLVAALGNTFGSGLLYLAGRSGGRPLVRRFGRYFLMRESDLDRAERRLSGRQTWPILLARVLPVVRTYVGFCAGALRLPLAPFLTLTFVGSLLWCLPFISLGAILGANWQVIQGPAKIVGLVALGLLLMGLVIATLREMHKSETQAPE